MDQQNRSAVKLKPATAAAKTIVLERIFKAPRELVWKTWTESERIMRWWGPKPFTAPVIKIDFRVGGTYLYCMRSPEGQNYWSTGIFHEIIPMDKIVYTDSFADADGNVVSPETYGMVDFPAELMVTVTFEDHAGQTKLILRHEGIPAGEMSEMTEAGWSTSLEKFAEALNDQE
jgi:uncharacterized protein YndB with AHSA1/START domain